MVSLTCLYSLRGCKFIHTLIQNILIACQSYAKFYAWLLIKIEDKGIGSGEEVMSFVSKMLSLAV